MKYNMEWFKENLEKKFSTYNVEYRSFNDGDFGDLNQVVFESSDKGGGIDFWSENYLGINLYDYQKDIEVLNIMLSPEEENEKEKAINKLIYLL